MGRGRNAIVALAVTIGATGCAKLPTWVPGKSEPKLAARREIVVSHPGLAAPRNIKATSIWAQALKTRGKRVLVSTEARTLWLMQDTQPVFTAPIAVGRSKRLIYKGREYDFSTPVGKRKVLAKATSPIWTPPDWHYFEIAVERGLEVVHLHRKSRIPLTDNTRIEVRGNQVGRVNHLGNFWPFTPGMEIIFEGKIFIPPLHTRQRRVDRKSVV